MSKVTVVVPVYNVEKYLAKCIDSVLNQTERDFTLILVDDGSTDNGPKICDEYAKKDSRIKVIHQENQGLGGARNTGIESCETDRIIFLDSDDTIEPETLEVTLKSAEKNDADMVIFGFRSVTEDGETKEVFVDNLEKNKAFSVIENKEVLTAHPSACNKLYKTSLFTGEKGKVDKTILTSAPAAWNKLYKTALFTETGIRYPSRVWYEDIRTTLKLMLYSNRIVFIENVLYNYLLRDGSITKNVNADRNVEIIEAFEDILAYFKEVGCFDEFHDELEYLTIFHVYITASVRVIRIDRKHELIDKFYDYLESNFPKYRENKYLPLLGRNKTLIYKLLEKKMYRSIDMIFKIKS